MTGAPDEIGIVKGALTYADLLTLPEDGRRHEILDGDLVVTGSPFTRHQRVSRNLGMILHLYVKERGLGEVFHAPIDVILDRHTIAVPDLVYVSNARASIITERCIEGTPDLLVEILSPSTADRDRGVKAKLYARFGVEHYWILDADARVLEAFSRSGGGGYGPATPHAGDAVLRSALFPGLALDLSKVWA